MADAQPLSQKVAEDSGGLQRKSAGALNVDNLTGVPQEQQQGLNSRRPGAVQPACTSSQSKSSI